MVLELKKRLQFPPGDFDITKYGPTNSDLNSSFENPVWCHDNTVEMLNDDSENEEGRHHAMLKCQCNVPIPEKGYNCAGCKSFVSWTSGFNEFIRFPEYRNGWGDFYCSHLCIFEFPPETTTFFQELCLEVIIASLSKN